MRKLNIYNLKNISKKLNYNEVNSKAAEMSFYLLLSIFPFLIFTISMAVYLPQLQLNKSIDIIQSIIPESAFHIVLPIINSAIDNKSLSLLILSFIFTISIFVIIFSSTILLVFGELIGYFIFGLIGLNKVFMYIWNILRYVVGISTFIIILINLYKFTPNKKILTKDVLPGSIVATLVYLVISLAYSYYTNNFSNYNIIYGSIGGIIILITWLYLSSWSILIGHEVNVRLYFRRYKNKNSANVK